LGFKKSIFNTKTPYKNIENPVINVTDNIEKVLYITIENEGEGFNQCVNKRL